MTFENLRKSNPTQPTVALFYGANCAPCARLKPKLQALADTHKFTPHQFDAAQNMESVRALGIRGVPTLVSLKHGQAGAAEVTVLFTGDKSQDELESILETVGVVQK